MIELLLMNGQRVEVSQDEENEFITRILVPNPDWHYSGLLTQEEVYRYLKGESTQDELKKVARYILIYQENLAFTAYLFDKADGKPEQSKEFNMPVIQNLRDICRRLTAKPRTPDELAGDVHEMESACMSTGANPL